MIDVRCLYLSMNNTIWKASGELMTKLSYPLVITDITTYNEYEGTCVNIIINNLVGGKYHTLSFEFSTYPSAELVKKCILKYFNGIADERDVDFTVFDRAFNIPEMESEW